MATLTETGKRLSLNLAISPMPCPLTLLLENRVWKLRLGVKSAIYARNIGSKATGRLEFVDALKLATCVGESGSGLQNIHFIRRRTGTFFWEIKKRIISWRKVRIVLRPFVSLMFKCVRSDRSSIHLLEESNRKLINWWPQNLIEHLNEQVSIPVACNLSLVSLFCHCLLRKKVILEFEQSKVSLTMRNLSIFIFMTSLSLAFARVCFFLKIQSITTITCNFWIFARLVGQILGPITTRVVTAVT